MEKPLFNSLNCQPCTPELQRIERELEDCSSASVTLVLSVSICQVGGSVMFLNALFNSCQAAALEREGWQNQVTSILRHAEAQRSIVEDHREKNFLSVTLHG